MSKALKALQNRKAALVGAMRKLSDEAAGEERAPTEEEQTVYDKHKAELASVDDSLSREQELMTLERSVIDDVAKTTEFTWEKEHPKTPLADPNQGKADEKEKQWGGPSPLGSMLLEVARASRQHPSQYDPRLVPSAITGLGESVASEGGFLVGTDMAAGLLSRIYDNTQFLTGGANYDSVTAIPISSGSNGVKINAVNETSRADGSRSGGVQIFWTEEGGTKADSKPALRQIELSLKKLIGLYYATDELLADASALEAIVSKIFADEFAFVLQNALFDGDGAGKPLGFLQSNALVTVPKEGGQAAASVVKANIDKMYSRLWARGLPRSVWFINQDVQPALDSLVDAGNNSVYLPPGGLSAQPFGTLKGRPVVPIEQSKTLGTLGDITFCDLGEYYYATKGPMQTASSIHVRFVNDETAFRFVLRVDGTPAWNNVLTPFQGTATQSPFIALATRA